MEKEEDVEIRKQTKFAEKNIPSLLEKERKRKEAEERNLRYKQLKPLEVRLAEVEDRLEVLMEESDQMQSDLADSKIYEVKQKNRLMKIMIFKIFKNVQGFS